MLGNNMGMVKETSRLSTLGHKWCHTDGACSVVQRWRWTLKCNVWHVVIYMCTLYIATCQKSCIYIYIYICVWVCVCNDAKTKHWSVCHITFRKQQWHCTLQFSQGPPSLIRKVHWPCCLHMLQTQIHVYKNYSHCQWNAFLAPLCIRMMSYNK